MTSKLSMTTACLSLVAGSALAAIATPAQAFNFNTGSDLGACGVLVDNFAPIPSGALLDGTTDVKTCTTADGFTLEVKKPEDGYLQGKHVNGVSGVGITSPGPTLAEIGGKGAAQEIMKVTLPAAEKLSTLGLSFLYKIGEVGDVVNEQAKVWVSDQLYGILSVINATEAEWVVYTGGVAGTGKTYTGDFTSAGPGYVNILNPFANVEISAFKLLAPVTTAGNTFRYSDFALVNADINGVPEPAALLGLGAVGAAMLGLRRRRSL